MRPIAVSPLFAGVNGSASGSSFGAIFPLAALSMALLWTGIGYPRLDERLAGNMGFGPEWNCSSDGSGAGVCLRKPPASMPPSTARAVDAMTEAAAGSGPKVYYNSRCPVCRAGIESQRRRMAAAGAPVEWCDINEHPEALAEIGAGDGGGTREVAICAAPTAGWRSGPMPSSPSPGRPPARAGSPGWPPFPSSSPCSTSSMTGLPRGSTGGTGAGAAGRRAAILPRRRRRIPLTDACITA